jgi:formate dehydrogenase subunit delta
MSTRAKIVRMINQIADNVQNEVDPASATAEHIRLFWDPRMKALLLEDETDGLNETAARARAQLRGLLSNCAL